MNVAIFEELLTELDFCIRESYRQANRLINCRNRLTEFYEQQMRQGQRKITTEGARDGEDD